MHLTNYSINKNSENFIFNKSSEKDDVGHKRSIKPVFNYLKKKGVNVDLIWHDIIRIIIKTFCAA